MPVHLVHMGFGVVIVVIVVGVVIECYAGWVRMAGIAHGMPFSNDGGSFM